MMRGSRGFMFSDGTRHALQAAGLCMSVLLSCTIGLRTSGACVIFDIVGNPTSFLDHVGINRYGILQHINSLKKQYIAGRITIYGTGQQEDGFYT
jgi:hypothetical protein